MLADYLEKNPYFQRGEDIFLRSVLSDLPPSPEILEIGTFRGWSAILMAKVRTDAYIITVDPHVGIPEDELSSSSDEVNSNLRKEGVETRVLHVKQYSQHYSPPLFAGFDLIFIDGDHSFDGVKHDFEKFFPFVKGTGIILFHDYGNEKGVTEFCNTLKFRTCKRFKGMLAIRKEDLL